MTAQVLPRPRSRSHWLLLATIGTLIVSAGAWRGDDGAIEAWYLVFVLLSGLATGSLGLLLIGHLMSEEWLTPIRSEAEAAALTMPLLALLAVPLVFDLSEIFPWAVPGGHLDIPRTRAAFLDAPFFLARGGVYISVWTVLAVWITRTRHVSRASVLGLALLAPTVTFAANDWVFSREPLWWSSLFGFAFAISQLLAALAGAILVSLLRPEHPSAERMKSLERALLTLALLALWGWFVQFLIVWLANLPDEAAWYLARSGDRLWLLGAAAAMLVGAVVILVPPGFGRRTMIVGSALLLLHHVAHMLWLMRPSAPSVSWAGAAVLAFVGLWAAWFAIALRGRPTFAAERGEGAPSA